MPQADASTELRLEPILGWRIWRVGDDGLLGGLLWGLAVGAARALRRELRGPLLPVLDGPGRAARGAVCRMRLRDLRVQAARRRGTARPREGRRRAARARPRLALGPSAGVGARVSRRARL